MKASVTSEPSDVIHSTGTVFSSLQMASTSSRVHFMEYGTLLWRLKAIILPVSPLSAACTPNSPARIASCWSVSESMDAEQRWLTLSSTERALTPRRLRTRFSRYLPQPASILWPKASVPAALSYSQMKVPSLSWIPSDTQTTTLQFFSKEALTFRRNSSTSKSVSGR